MKDLEYSSFHQVRRGHCLIQCGTHQDIAGPGDIIFLPKGSDHVLRSVEPSLPDNEKTFQTMLLCGYFQFDQALEHPLLATLPELIIIRSEALEHNHGLKQTLNFLSDEFTSNQPGANLLLDKLTEVMFIQLIRTEFKLDQQSNFSKALFDNKISQALKLLHSDPANNWTLDKLATSIGYSRTALANRFKIWSAQRCLTT